MKLPLRQIGLIAGALLVLALLAWAISGLLGHKSGPAPKAPKISLIPTTPPPPPPPPKEDKRPDPPKQDKQEINQPAPPKEAAPAPSQDLKMDGPAGDGPSAFSSGKITNDDLSQIGKGTGPAQPVAGLFNPFTNYATGIKGELQRYLARNKELRQRAYKVDVQLWVGSNGALSRYELIGSSGDTEVDELIRQSLTSFSNFSQTPPERMPQPIRLRLITGR